jgi:hypothetical protein
LVRDDNQTVLILNIKSSIKKIYLNYFCASPDQNNNQTSFKLCYVELDAVKLHTNVNTSNFLALKVCYYSNLPYKNRVKVYNTKSSYRNTKNNFLHTNLFAIQSFFEHSIQYKITIFEISFERSKIFQNGFYQKVALKKFKNKN